jgi:predicted dehydrogenase
MGKKINVAIVGLGFGAEFIPNLSKASGCKHVCHLPRNKEKLNQVGDEFGIEMRYT